MKKKIDLIFTRDFSLCVCDFWQILLTKELKREFGMGINSQIMRFNGRALEAYRIRKEMINIKNHIISKDTNDPLFSENNANNFIKNINKTKSLLKEFEKSDLDFQKENFDRITYLFKHFYPFVMLSTFLPGPWKNEFLLKHPIDGKNVFERWYEARIKTEGTFEQVDAYWRNLIAQLLEKHGIDNKYSRSVRFSEFKKMLFENTLPKKEELEERKKGYILFKEKLMVGKDFTEFLNDMGFEYEDLNIKNEANEIMGNVAYEGGKVAGKVQFIFNSNEVSDFKEGNILVTAMTIPEFIPAMKKAKAIITDEGGITCHAAITSRELGIPCIIGTKKATKILKEGDEVELDASKGIIKKII